MKLKRVFAGLFAAATLSACLGGMSVNAAGDDVTYYEWYARYVGGGAPSSADYIDNWAMAGSTQTYTGVCTSMTEIVTRSVKIYSTTHTMVAASGYTLTYDSGVGKYVALYNTYKSATNSGTIKWRISGTLSAVTYEASCIGGSVLHCYGYVSL